jgi:hypothetical protein
MPNLNHTGGHVYGAQELLHEEVGVGPPAFIVPAQKREPLVQLGLCREVHRPSWPKCHTTAPGLLQALCVLMARPAFPTVRHKSTADGVANATV